MTRTRTILVWLLLSAAAWTGLLWLVHLIAVALTVTVPQHATTRTLSEQRDYRGALRLVAAWATAHGLTVVDADAVADAARASLDLSMFTVRSGHLTRAYHAGKVVRDLSWRVVTMLGQAATAVWE
jgi:hypothetical protein